MKLLKILSFITLLFLIAILLSVLVIRMNGSTHTLPLINPVREVLSNTIHNVRSPFAIGIDTIVSSQDLTPGTYSIVVINLKNDEIYTQNSERVYKSASLYKLWVMAAVYSKLANNTLSKTDVLTENIENLNRSFNIATDSAEKTEGQISLSVQDALSATITQSDNYSALLLLKKIGISSVNTFLKNEKLMQSKTTFLPTTTAGDIAMFFYKLHHRQLINASSSQEMLDLLKQQKINDRIPYYLPDNVSVAHKTGELDSFKHDAGIVYTPKGDYILVLMSESEDPKTAAIKMANLSKKIYQLFASVN